jgi:diadenosine tetraphosphate (Ap4A) HIT family hydrolase
VALPTLGQLFTGSLLVLPIEHTETCAALPVDLQREMLRLLDDMVRRAREFGHPVVFEHGAVAATGGGCGIHHAHMHIVPVPKATAASTLFPEHAACAPDIQTALGELHSADEYLLLAADDAVLFRDLRVDAGAFPSQFFRRRLAEHFQLTAPWDWRAYDAVEPALLDTLGLQVW